MKICLRISILSILIAIILSQCKSVPKNADGTTYSGELKDGKPEGQGTQIWPEGDRYIGSFRNGKHDGKGTYTFPDGGTYTGDWKEGQREGNATATYSNGDKYVGEYKNGNREGYGTLQYANGEIYVGEWKIGMRNGKGTHAYPNGDVYEGDFKLNVPVYLSASYMQNNGFGALIKIRTFEDWFTAFASFNYPTETVLGRYLTPFSCGIRISTPLKEKEAKNSEKPEL